MCYMFGFGMLVWGIATIAQGEMTLPGSKVVRGALAYVLGLILAGTLPLLFAIAFTMGVLAAIKNGGQPVEIENSEFIPLLIAEVVGVPLILAIVVGVAYANAEEPPNPYAMYAPQQYPPGANYPPPDPNNPYASPHLPATGQAPNPFADQGVAPGQWRPQQPPSPPSSDNYR